MAPPSASSGAAVRRVVSSPGRGSEHGGRGAARRPSLRAVPGGRKSGRRLWRAEGLVATLLSVSLVVGALLVVVAGHALLADGQVRMAAIQHQLTLEQSAHRHTELQVSQLETPSRIVSAALGRLHLVHPPVVIQIPFVPLTSPLATPKVTPAPAAAPSSTTTPKP